MFTEMKLNSLFFLKVVLFTSLNFSHFSRSESESYKYSGPPEEGLCQPHCPGDHRDQDREARDGEVRRGGGGRGGHPQQGVHEASRSDKITLLKMRDCIRDCSGDWYYPEWLPWGWVILLVTLLTSSLSIGLVFSGGHVTAAAINSRLGLGADNVTGVMVTAGSLSSTMMMAPLTTKLCTRNDDLTLDTSSNIDIPTFYRKWI